MSNYKCYNCEKTFEDPLGLREPDGLDSPPYRYSYCCPYCRSDDYAEIIGRCGCCSCNIGENEQHYELTTGEVFCVNCIEERNG